MVTSLNEVIEQGQAVAFSGYGEVYSFTVVQDPPAGFEAYAPYAIALVKLDEGQLVTAQLTDVEGDIAIGDRVQMVTRRLATEGPNGMIVYGYKFRKVLS